MSSPEVPDAVEIRLQLRWSDLDALGHVNNVTIARIFEEARVRFFVQVDLFSDVTAVVARQEVAYLRPLLYDVEGVRTRIWVGKVGTKSLVLVGEMRNPAGEVVAETEVTCVTVGRDDQRPEPVPAAVRERLAQHGGPRIQFRR